MNALRFLIFTIIISIGATSGGFTVYGAGQSSKGKSSKTVATTKNSGNSKSGKGVTPKKISSKGKAKSQTVKKKETSADIRKRQQATQKEIEATKAEIARTDKEIGKNLGVLTALRGEIDLSEKNVRKAETEVKSLDTRINELGGQIEENERLLKAMREEYMKSLKKMRARKGNSSDLAFIFSSKNFNQAMRRMRYLREFSSWREGQTEKINSKVKSLSEQRALLEQSRLDKDAALKREAASRASLQKQFAERDAVVADLRKNSSSLKSHLAAKQNEANVLRNRISTLIAEEEAVRAREAKAKAEREERQRKEKAAAEKAAAEKAEKERIERERQEKLLAENNDGAKKETPKKEAPKKETSKKDVPKKELEKKESVKDFKKKDNGGERNYAEARKRAPRGDSSKKSETPAASASNGTVSGSSFASLKGSLPRPVTGAFRVTSHFGRHPLPDLPEVMYDNPGIDAEVAKGASALTVSDGKVTGVYVIPGYNTVVIVSHGEYYSVYGNLASPSVSVGQNLSKGQVVGKVAAMEDNPSKGSIHFEIWKNRVKQNPLEWIR